MKAFFSKSTGLGISWGDNGRSTQAWDFVSGSPIPHDCRLTALSHVEDWEEASFGDIEAAQTEIRQDYTLLRLKALCDHLLLGLSPKLAVRVSKHAEDILRESDLGEPLIDTLLSAPLSVASRFATQSDRAMSIGARRLAQVFNSAWNYQDSLKKLADAWLKLGIAEFSALGVPPQELWKQLVRSGRWRALLDQTTAGDFSYVWNEILAKGFPFRSSLDGSRLESALVEALFPNESTRIKLSSSALENLMKQDRRAVEVIELGRAPYPGSIFVSFKSAEEPYPATRPAHALLHSRRNLRQFPQLSNLTREPQLKHARTSAVPSHFEKSLKIRIGSSRTGVRLTLRRFWGRTASQPSPVLLIERDSGLQRAPSPTTLTISRQVSTELAPSSWTFESRKPTVLVRELCGLT